MARNKREEAKFQFRVEFTERIRRNGFPGLVIDASIAPHPIDLEKSGNIFIEEKRNSHISTKAMHWQNLPRLQQSLFPKSRKKGNRRGSVCVKTMEFAK